MKLRMVDGRRNAELLVEIVLNFERVLDRRRVDDAGALERVVAGEERGEDLELVGFFVGLARFVDQVRAIESADDRLDVIDAELVQDVFAHRRRRGRRQRQHGRMAELGDHAAERQIRGPKVVAPLTDAVRFVDDEERHVDRLQQLQEGFVFEFLRRRVDDAHAARARCARARAFLDLRRASS